LLTLIATPVVFTWFDDISHSRFVAAFARIVSWPFRKIDGLFSRNVPAVPAASVAPTSSDEDVRTSNAAE
jgi:hypothetical protein